MGSIRVEQVYRLVHNNMTYQLTVGGEQDTASLTLPDGQFVELPAEVLCELASLCASKSARTASAIRKYPRTGEVWTHDEEKKLSRSFFDGTDFKLIAQVHQRSKGAIIRRLEKLGHLVPRHTASP